jgi:hypothetical protein
MVRARLSPLHEPEGMRGPERIIDQPRRSARPWPKGHVFDLLHNLVRRQTTATFSTVKTKMPLPYSDNMVGLGTVVRQ